jgi:hypothetical protein
VPRLDKIGLSMESKYTESFFHYCASSKESAMSKLLDNTLDVWIGTVSKRNAGSVEIRINSAKSATSERDAGNFGIEIEI